MKILVTGASGTLGTEVVKHLVSAGADVRAAIHSPQKVQKLKSAKIEIVEVDYGKPETLKAAMRGAEKVFSLTPLMQNMVELSNIITDEAKKAGIKHIVRQSGMGSEYEAIQLARWHRAAERHIESSEIAWTFLRPNSFMQNFLTYPAVHGVYYMPMGEGRTSYVDVRDVAAVATKAILETGHEGKAYTITGTEALTVGEAAAYIAKSSGKDIKYADVPEDAARKGMEGAGMPKWLADVLLELMRIGKEGYTAAVTNTIEEVTGNKPRRFAQFSKDYAGAF